MPKDLIIFVFFYFLIIFSTIGYGLVVEKIFNLKKYSMNLGFIGLLGVLFLVTYSYISHFLIPHGIYHNLTLIIVGFVASILLLKQKKNVTKLLILIFITLFVGFLMFKTHDDFPYYHFPYTYLLTQNPLIFGIGNLNLGFRTPSSIFFLNSLFYLPVIKYFFFQMGATIIYGFSILILLLDINKKLNLNKIDSTFFLRLFSLLFIFIFFYRIQEHGTDRSAQILVLLFLVELINLIKDHKNFNANISKIIIIFSLIIGLKLFYVLYVLFIIPVIYYFLKIKKNNLFFNLLGNNLFYFSLLSFFCYILIYFINTGCFLYPVTFSCAENFPWSLKISEVERLKLHYENWSKAGAGAGYSNNNPQEYVQSFNWINNWVDKYFFNKVFDFLLGLVFLTLILILVFFKKKILS